MYVQSAFSLQVNFIVYHIMGKERSRHFRVFSPKMVECIGSLQIVIQQDDKLQKLWSPIPWETFGFQPFRRQCDQS